MTAPFAKTTLGPPAPTGFDTDKHHLIADQLNGTVEMVDDAGIAHGMQSMNTMLQAQTALVTITTAQTLFTQNLAAFFLNRLNRVLLITGTMIFSTAAANTPTISIALKLGATTICTLTSAAVAASTTNGQLQFQFEVTVASTGASGTVEAHGSLLAQLSATLTTALANYLDGNTAVSGAINLTQPLALSATITAAGGTVSSAQLRQLTIEVEQ